MFNPDKPKTERHYGKCMVVMDKDNNQITLKSECAECGAFEVTLPLLHLRSTINILEKCADEMGLPGETIVSQVEERINAHSRSEVDQLTRELFDEMSLQAVKDKLDQQADTVGSFWE